MMVASPVTSPDPATGEMQLALRQSAPIHHNVHVAWQNLAFKSPMVAPGPGGERPVSQFTPEQRLGMAEIG